MKIKFKENLFVFLLVLYSSIGSSKAESASLDVSIDEITTTTLKISLAPADEGSSVQLWDVELDIQVLNYTYGNQIEFRDLFDGRLYELSVNGTGNRKWMSSITTAQCPEQWMGLRNNCYKRFNKKENRNAANLECSTSVLGAHLADPRRTEEFEFISSAEILTSTVALNWIGISLDGSNATYTDGSPVTEEIQAFKEEDDKASENCAVIQSNMNEYKWIEAQCEYETYFICEYTVPQCATNINISTSETSADIAWKTPKSLHGSDFGQYTIEIKEIKDFVTEKYIISRSSLNYTLPGLKSGHLYFFSIQASISTLHFESKSAKYTHAFLTNPNPPRHLRLINKSPTTITITWNKPESSHDNIFDKYCITYGETKIYVHKNFTTYTLEKLSPYTEYNIKVFSVSQISYLEKLSTAPADTSLTVLTDVSPVKDLRLIPESRHVTNFTITWSFAEGVVDSYEIQITENASDGQNPRIIEVENTANEFLISNLIPGQLYQVTVITKRLDGESDPVTLSERTSTNVASPGFTQDFNEIRATHQPSAQSRPPISHVHVQTKIGVDSVKIDIFESGSNHQKFYYSGYILSFTSSFQGKDEFIKKSESGITSSIITGLIPGTTYDFKAYTISGDVKSMPSDRGKISMELSPPEDFRVLTRNETSILVGWSSSRGEVSRYLVTCDECHDGAKLIGIDKANEAMFLKLSAGAEYVFTIVSQTSSNKEQRASKQVELVTRTKPKVPQNVAIDFVNQTSAVISWLPVDGTKSGYRVENVALENQYFTTRPANASWFRDKESVIVEQGKIIANLNDVTPGVAYHARVFSVSDDTSSEPASVFLTMLPNAVTHVKPSEVDEYWSTLRWKPGFGGYFEFLVEITLAGDEETVDTAYVTESNYNSTLPAPATLYYASISTLTLDRTWQSVPAGIFIQSRPLAVTDVEVYDVGEKSFTVRWNRPKSLYDNFRVVLSSDDIEDRKEFTEMSYVKFTDLIPGATYELKIFAIYNETSSHEVTATATLFPLAPTNLVSTGRTSTTISVKWNEAIGRADSYPIEWTPIDGEISIIDETATLSDLIPGVTYDIKVYAKSQNNIRRSEESAQVSIETKEALPGSPIFQSITTVDPTSVDIFWLKTPHPNGKILQHTIRYKQVYPHSHEEYEYKNFTATAESGRLESLDPGAWYVVHIRAQNSKGPGEWTNGEFIKNLPSLPGPVYNLTATAEKSRSLTITWETPEQPNGYIMQYELTVKDNMDNKIASVIFDRNLSGNPFECFEGQEPVPMNLFLQTLPTINDTLITGEKTFEANCPVSYMLEDLEAYSPYRIYVESFTSIGKGVSETTTGRTLEEAPSGPPQNIVVKNVGPTYLTLEWNPPDFPNGELTYSVSYFDRSGLVLRTTTNLSYYTMEDLRPYAVYAIHLIANTKAGSSEWTDFLLLNTTQDVPNKPVELSGKVMNSKSVYLSWYPPSGTRGIVTSYQVVIYDIDKQKSLRTDIVYSNARNITEQPSLSLNTGENENLPHPSVVPEVIAKIQELESKITIGVNETINYLVQHLNPYTLYEFRISAVTSAGPGNYSATQVKTAEDKPGSKPTNLRYENISSTSVNLTWAEPESPNGAIVAYEVIYISDEKELRFEVFDTTYAILKNMKKYSLYSVFVNSRTSAGRGPPSEELEMLTDEDVPGSPPFNLRYVNVTPTVAEVEWDPPLIPNGVIQFYTVYYKNETKEYSRKSNSTVIYLYDLRVYGEYWVQISASTRYGDGGLRSEPLYVHTGEGEPGSPPHELAYKNMTSSSVVLSWKKPLEPNGIIQHYVIRILPDSSEEYLRLQTEGADTEFVVENLKPDSSYTVLVHAHTKHGDGGVESDPLQIHTKEDAPGSPPKSLSYKNLSSTSVELSWNEPATPNGQIENYIIYYNDKILTVTASGSSVKINVDDLEPYTTYEFNVSASTKAGEGPTTSITVYTDEDSPTSAPRDVTYVQLSSTAITLSWKPPRKPNGIVTEYLVEYSIEDNVFDSVTYETNVTLSDLQKYATYLATVTAFTRVGQGPSSSPVIFQTLEDAPSDPPRNVTAISEESTSMFVSWEPPMQPNGIIQFYTVFIGDGENIRKNKVINATSTVVENLKIYTWYNIYVTASTALGDGGKKSDVIRSRTKEGVPDTSVNNLKALPVNSTSASISWSPPDRVTGILSYVVAVYKKNAADSPIFYTVIPDNKVFIDYLEPYTNYMVSVAPVVENVNETGLIAEVQFRTLEDRPWLPVADLNAVNITSTSAVLTWKATEKPNGVVIFHIIDVPKEKVNFEIPAETPEPTSRYEFTVKNLLPHTSYVAFVAPKTKVGTGPKESVQFTTSEGLPEDFATNVEIATITSNEASITWNPPAKPNGRIVTYKIVYYEIADDNKVDHETEKFVILPTPETHYTLENLRAFTTYKLIIFSTNSAGVGPIHSLPEFFTTLEDVPAAPILECNPLNQNNIILTWQPPNNPNGNIISYKIKYYLEAKPSDKINNVTNGDEDSYIATGLLPFSYYIFELQAETKPGIGEPASCRVRTGEGFADPPKAIHTTNKTSTSLSVNWMEPDQFNGQLLHYAVLYRPPHYCWKNLGSVVTVSDREVCKLKSAETTKTIFYLENYSIYTVSVAAVTGAGLGKVGLKRTFKTLVGAPSYPPRNVKGHAISSTAINVTWTEPLVLAGPTTYQIVVKLGEKTIKESDEYPSEISEVTVADLDKDTRYAVSVSAITSAGKLSSGNTMIRTDEDAPSDPPVLLRVNTTDGNTSTVLVEFLPPGDPNGAIYEYNLQYKSEKANHNMTIHILDADLPYTGEPVTNTSPHWMIVTGLLGGRNYYFRMNSATQEGTGPWSVWSSPILLPVNSPPVPNVTLVITSFGEENKAASSKLLVDICGVFSDENGPLENITVIVAEDEDKIDKDPTHWFEAYYMKPSPPYMVRATSNPVEFCSPDGQISKSTRKRRSIAEAPKFVLGNDQTCETTKKPYCNGPLKSNTPYRLKLRGTTTNGEYTETEFSDPVRTRSSFLEANMYLIVGLVVGIVVFVIFVIILVCVIRKRLTQQSLNESQRSDRSSGSLNKRATSSLPASPHNMSFVMEPTNVKGKKSITRPVSKAHFPNHVTRMSAHNDKGFASEFEEIESVTPFGPKTIGSQACNKSKNRFAEIIPYDHYRVKIENLGSTESSGYINASYIPGSSTPEQYIATQSPLGHTKNDLWRMIWETGAKRIIMLGNVDLEGNDHCTKYWPNTSQTTYYGNLSVQSLHEERQPEWTIRNFTISKREKRRQLTQYHFTMWPVRGVPDNPQPLVRFLQTFRMGKPVGDSPTVVMCSTGSGRTAVFIALDIIMDTIDKEINIDPCGVVADLRNYRPYMIQTAAEYSFLHRCLAYVLTSVSSEKSSVRSPTGDGEETTMF